jgi:hypothetical protein
MPGYDYTDAPPPQWDLIPDGTIATIVLHINAGNVGEDGMLTRSQDGGCEMLAGEFTVADGPHKGRRFWMYMVMEGTTQGHAQAISRSRGTIKAILDSALNLMPDDKSDKARALRNVTYKQLEGITFIGKIGIEKGGPKKDGTGDWPDKNVLAAVITPDKKDWHPVEQPPPFNGGGGGAQAAASSSTPAPIERPGWAS